MKSVDAEDTEEKGRGRGEVDGLWRTGGNLKRRVRYVRRFGDFTNVSKRPRLCKNAHEAVDLFSFYTTWTQSGHPLPPSELNGGFSRSDPNLKAYPPSHRCLTLASPGISHRVRAEDLAACAASSV